MKIESNHIAKYIEGFLNNIFIQKITIESINGKYIVNNRYKIKIYEFWNKSDTHLLKDFRDYTFYNDMVGTMFFFLSGYWELKHQDNLDIYGRFLGKESFAYKKRVIEKPVVDILVSRLSKDLQLTYKREHTGNTVFLTHDIDFLGMFNNSRFYKSLCGDIIKRKDPKMFIKKLWKVISKDDPHAVEHLIRVDKDYEARGTFFFMPDIQPHNTYGGYRPQENTDELLYLKSEILSNQGSIGIHYDSRYLEEERMESDVSRLSKVMDYKICFGRSHYLLFNITKTFDILEKSGIELDSSGGYADVIGFRFGTSFPFKPYNFKLNREYNLIEVPLIVMDTTLRGEGYMNLSPQESISKIKEMINTINEHKGIFTFLWHNTSFYSNGWEDWGNVYIETLAYLKSIKSTFLSADDIMEKEISENKFKYI